MTAPPRRIFALPKPARRAQSSTASIRPRSRFAVSVFVAHSGSRTANTIPTSTASTGTAPNTGWT